MEMPNPYKGNYKILVAIPLLLVLASIFFIPQIKKGVDFKGGTMVTMQTAEGVDEAALASALASKGYAVSSVKSLKNPKGYEVEVEIERDENLTRAEELKLLFFSRIEDASRLESDVDSTNYSAEAVDAYSKARKEVDEYANGLFAIAQNGLDAASIGKTTELKQEAGDAYRQIIDRYSSKLTADLSSLVTYETASFNEVSSSLSEKFIEKALWVVLASAILVTVVVFLIFRTIVPSAAVLLGAACDLIVALGAMGLFGIPLTLASFAGLLMIVGFSLDTSVLLTMRVMKRKDGTPQERAYDAMKTGVTMSMALLLSFTCLFILSIFTHINTYFEVSSVAIAGLVGDIAAVWLLNGAILLWHLERGGSTGGEARPFHSSFFSG